MVLLLKKEKKNKIASSMDEYIFYKNECNSIKNKWSALSFTASYELLLGKEVRFKLEKPRGSFMELYEKDQP